MELISIPKERYYKLMALVEIVKEEVDHWHDSASPLVKAYKEFMEIDNTANEKTLEYLRQSGVL